MLSKAPIKKIARVGAGQGAPQKDSDFSNEGNPFIRAGSIEELLNGGDEMNLPKVNSEIAKQYKLRLYPPNTIVFAKSGMSAMKGRIYKLKNPCYVVNHLATLQLNGNADPDFVVYTLREFSPVKLINDISYPSLKQSKIEAYEIPLPSLSTQIQIANILCKAETLIEQRKQSIALLDEFLKSTFLEMFGDPRDISKKDNVKTIGKICFCRGGGTPSKAKPEYFTGHIPWVSPKDMKFLYITTSQDKITEQAIKDSSTTLIHKGAVLMVIRSGILKNKLPLAINKVDVTINQDMKAFSSDEVCSPYLLYFFFAEEKNILKKVKGTTAENLNFDDIKKLKIKIPPFELQNQFAAIVAKTEALKEQYKNSLQELGNLYGSLSQKAFKGELTFNEEEEAPLMMAAEPDVKYN